MLASVRRHTALCQCDANVHATAARVDTMRSNIHYHNPVEDIGRDQPFGWHPAENPHLCGAVEDLSRSGANSVRATAIDC